MATDERGEPYDVFISHTGQDDLAASFAVSLKQYLEEKGIHSFLDAEDLHVGDLWRERLLRCARESKVFVCVLSPHFFFRKWCMLEMDAAFQGTAEVLPILYMKEIPEFRSDEFTREFFRVHSSHKERQAWYANLTDKLDNIQYAARRDESKQGDNDLRRVLYSKIVAYLDYGKHRCRRLLYIGGVFAILVASAAVAVAVIRLKESSTDETPSPTRLHASSAPTMKPTVLSHASFSPTDVPEPLEAAAIVEYINSISLSPNKPHQYPPPATGTTPEEQALAWLVDNPINAVYSSDLDRLRQRYSLAVFWYNNNGVDWGYDAGRFDNWLLGEQVDECKWEKVNCTETNQISQISLSFDFGVRGTLPAEVGLWTALTSLGLYNNDLTGTIPTQVGAWTALMSLDLRLNNLTGPIPTHAGAWTTLTALYLSNNALTGSIPTEIGALTALMSLYSWGNALTGTIPTQVGALTALTTLSLAKNQLFGTIPDVFQALVSLDWLYLHGNDLTGTTPISLCETDELFDIHNIVADCVEFVDQCSCCNFCCPAALNGTPKYTGYPSC